MICANARYHLLLAHNLKSKLMKTLIQYKNLFLEKSITTREVIFAITVILCFTPVMSPPLALLLGLIVAQIIGHPYLHLNHKATHILLQISVVGLGFGMNVNSALKAGKEGILFTIVSIGKSPIFKTFIPAYLPYGSAALLINMPS